MKLNAKQVETLRVQDPMGDGSLLETVEDELDPATHRGANLEGAIEAIDSAALTQLSCMNASRHDYLMEVSDVIRRAKRRIDVRMARADTKKRWWETPEFHARGLNGRVLIGRYEVRASDVYKRTGRWPVTEEALRRELELDDPDASN